MTNTTTDARRQGYIVGEFRMAAEPLCSCGHSDDEHAAGWRSCQSSECHCGSFSETPLSNCAPAGPSMMTMGIAGGTTRSHMRTGSRHGAKLAGGK